jgi:hypothetical protein
MRMKARTNSPQHRSSEGAKPVAPPNLSTTSTQSRRWHQLLRLPTTFLDASQLVRSGIARRSLSRRGVSSDALFVGGSPDQRNPIFVGYLRKDLAQIHSTQTTIVGTSHCGASFIHAPPRSAPRPSNLHVGAPSNCVRKSPALDRSFFFLSGTTYALPALSLAYRIITDESV